MVSKLWMNRILRVDELTQLFQNFLEDPWCSHPYFSKPYRWCIERKKIVQSQKPLKSTLISCFPRFFLLKKSFLPKNQPRHSKKEGVDSVFSRALLDLPTSDLRSRLFESAYRLFSTHSSVGKMLLQKCWQKPVDEKKHILHAFGGLGPWNTSGSWGTGGHQVPMEKGTGIK